MSYQFDRAYPQGPVAPVSSKLRDDLAQADDFQTSVLDSSQRFVTLGDTIPIVFGMRSGSVGGVFVSPPIVRVGHSTTCQTITSTVSCVLSDGRLPAVSNSDVWWGTVRSPNQSSTNFGGLASWASNSISAPARVYTETETRKTSAAAASIPVSYENSQIGLIYGTGAISVQSKTDRCTSFTTSISGSYRLQGSGNGLDGYPAFIVGKNYKGFASEPDPNSPKSYNQLAAKFKVSNATTVTVNWEKTEKKTANPDHPGTYRYEVTFDNPNRTKGSLYPPSKGGIPSNPTQSQIDSWLDDASTPFLSSPSTNSVTAPRDAQYIGSGTTLLVVEDSYVVTVSETNQYDCPLATGLPLSGGSGGNFAGITTLTVQNTSNIEDGLYSKQVHAFIRNGVYVDRLIEGSTGSSNQFPDLVRYFMASCAKVPAELIDDARLRSAAQFCAANKLYFNGVVNANANLREWLMQVAPFFLLTLTQVDGKYGLRPALPTNGTSISTGTVTPVMTFNNDNVLAGSFSRQSVDATDLRPFAALMLWREQPDNAPGLVQTTEVRYTGSAVDGPYETYDGSQFITSQDHAVKAARFFLAQRRHITHAASWSTSVQGALLNPGDVVRMTLSTESSTEGAGNFSELYQIDSIEETLGGLTTISARLFPVDSQGRSLVALDVTGGSFS